MLLTEYKEQWAPQRGGNGGTPQEFVCPAEGVITGIQYRSDRRLDRISFICTSSKGEKIIGPFGGMGGIPGEERCPPGQYIGSIHGRSLARVDKLGIRCVKIGQTGKSPKRDGHGGEGGEPFDDESFATNGRRPVQIRVRSGSEVDAIQIQYGNMPVNFNCSITRVEVTEPRITAQLDGYEVIGISTGSTCAPIEQQLTLQAAETVSDTISVEMMDGGEVNWSSELSLTFTNGVDFGIGFSAQRSIGVSQSFGGSKSWSRTESRSTSNSTEKSHGIVANYQGPGACVVVGFISRYKIEKRDIPVLYHFKCAGGDMAPQAGRITLTSNTFGFANFHDYQYKFDSVANCTYEARSCVYAIRADNIVSDPNVLDAQLKKCFSL